MAEGTAKDHCDDLVLTLTNTRSSASFARRQFAAYVRTRAPDPVSAADIILAVGEALANAAEHGHRTGGSLSIRAGFRAETDDVDRLDVEITDDGHGFAQRPHLARNASSPRGFGIFIMRNLMDAVEFHDGGRRVVLVKRLRRR